MFELLFKLIFKLIIKLFSLIISPFVLAVNALFPDFASLYNDSVGFITNYVVKYVDLICDLFFIPRFLVYVLFDFYLVLFSIQAIIFAVKLVINVYNKLKP